MKHCPAKYRPMVADLLDGRITPANRNVLLQELRKNPAFADELAELYGDHLVMSVMNQPDCTDQVMQEVYSVTRWCGESRETTRSIQQGEDGTQVIINETTSVTRWAGQSTQFIRNVERALLPRMTEKARRQTSRRILFGTAAAAFVALCIFAIFASSRKPPGQIPHISALENPADLKVIRNGFTYGINKDLTFQLRDVIQTAPGGSLTLTYADGSKIRINGDSTYHLSTARDPDGLPKLVVGSADCQIVPAPPNQNGFRLLTSDARLDKVHGAFSLAAKPGETFVRVADGSVQISKKADGIVRAATVVAHHEMTTAGSRAFIPKATVQVDDSWIGDLKPVAWLDADRWETVVLDDQKRVERWLDRSSNNCFFYQNDPRARPRLLEKEMNGRDAVYFASSAQFLTGIRSLKAAEIVIVCRPQGQIPMLGGVFGTLGDFGIRHTGRDRWQGQAKTSPNEGDFAPRGIFVNGDARGDASPGRTQVVSARRGASIALPQPVIGNYFRFPGYSPDSRPFHGVVCELLVFDAPLDDAIREKLIERLMEKWGVQRN